MLKDMDGYAMQVLPNSSKFNPISHNKIEIAH